MKTVFGALLLFGDILLKIPIIVWIIAFVAMCVWLVKSEEPNSKIAILVSMLFYFYIVNYFGIATHFIGTSGLGLIIPILIMIVAPYLATLATFVLLGIIKNN
ncbi:MAG: hypothetical protein KH216_00950 [Clostridiales bacterium]|jgi:hypothetical protein|nr:hypothetical protein [Clostridiales bacterium]